MITSSRAVSMILATASVAASTASRSSAQEAVPQRAGVVGDRGVPVPPLVGYGNAAARAAAAGAVTAERVRAPLALPMTAGTGPEVLRVQILLDAARFGPGVLDARWSENTSLALRAFREAQGLPDSQAVDAEVVRRLEAAAGGRDPLTRHTLTAADVRGPFRRVPRSIYAQARLDCLCYQSLLERLGEQFHTTADVLQRLNPDVDVARAAPGTALVVPNVARTRPPTAAVRLVVDKPEGAVRGVDARGRLVFWLPSTVGSAEEPSPRGLLRVSSVDHDPRYHYNPRVLGDVPDSRADAVLAPGPNSPVGVLWVQLSKPHVGIHGTADPELVGYAQSHGCVRVTNWDARWLAEMVRPGMPVTFR